MSCTDEQWKRVKYWWDLYKNTIGLEGDLYLKLKDKGFDDVEIGKEIEKHREVALKDREVWNDLRKEQARICQKERK